MKRPSPLSETCCVSPKLWLAAGQALFVGPGLGLSVHAGAVACLAVGLDGPFEVELGGETLRVQSALLGARERHRVIAGSTRMCFGYFDPGSTREAACLREMRGVRGGLRCEHSSEVELARIGSALLEGDHDADSWFAVATPLGAGRIDRRIEAVLRHLLTRPDDPRSADATANEIGLSSSRFLHLFRERTGTSYRRFRLWARMLHVGASIAEGRSLTAAAIDAGFASPSHFSSAFHDMFGLRPSDLLGRGLSISVGGPDYR